MSPHPCHSKPLLPRLLSRLLPLVAILLWSGPAPGAGETAQNLRAFVGGPAKLAWIRQVEGAGNDPLCWEKRHVLMALDTEELGGERILLDRVDNYHRPLIGARGDRVVFSQHSSRRFFQINWDGSGLAELGAGYALDLWQDPHTGREWVYYTVTGLEGVEKHNGNGVWRKPLDGPEPPEKVWDRTPITVDNFQLSADGTHACAQFPHPRAGIADLPLRKWMPLARGCWTSMAPDNSYWTWVFDGKHRNVTLCDPLGNRTWMVDIHSAPGIDGYEVYHPRWSNQRRFFALTGPYKIGRMGQNLIGAGGPGIEVLIGRFAPAYDRVEAWFQATDNACGDFYPDLWIDPGTNAAAVAAATAPAPAQAVSWPAVFDGLRFVWDQASRPDEIDGPGGTSIRHGPLEGKGRAFWGRYQEMWLAGGRFFSAAERVPSPAEVALRTGRTFEALVTPHPDLPAQNAIIWGSFHADNQPNWAWIQRGDQLHFLWPSADGLRESPALLKLEPGTTHHVIVAVDDNPPLLRPWLDGNLLAGVPLDSPPVWTSNDMDTLVFGGSPLPGAAWEGTLESVAVYDRALPAEEIAAHAGLQRDKLAKREPLPPIVVQARLVEAPPAPDPASISPYRRALGGQRYALEAVETGEFTAKEFVVAEWTILDAKQVPPVHATGEVVRLRLEPFEAHPQLESERLLIDAGLMLLPVFVDGGARTTGAPSE